MQSHNANTAAARFSQSHLDQVAGQMAASVLRFDIDIQQIAARGRTRIKRMRGPVKQQQTCARHHFTVIFSKPSEITLISNSLRHPRFVGPGH